MVSLLISPAPALLISLSVLCCLLSYATTQQVTPDGCWKRRNNCRLSCVRPFNVIDQEELDCLENCRSDSRCQGVVYNRSSRRCELYDNVPTGGTSGGRRGRPNNRGGNRRRPGGRRGPPPDFFRRNRFNYRRSQLSRFQLFDDQPASVPNGTAPNNPMNDEKPQQEPMLDQPNTGGYYRNDRSFESDDVSDQVQMHHRGGGRGGYYGNRHRRPGPPRKRGRGRKPGGGGNRCIVNVRGSTLYVWTGRCDRGPTTPFTIAPPTFSTTQRRRPTRPTTPPPTPPLPSKVVCPAGQEPRFLRIENMRMAGSNDFEFSVSNQEECLRACAENELPQGGQAPCASFEYNRITRTCTISLQTLRPTGSGRSEEVSGTDYFEKICLSTSVVTGCSDVFNQLPQTVLVGFARMVSTESSYAKCVESCADSQDLFGFRCVSGQYFFEVNEFNCILNSESKDTKPDLMSKEENDVVNYFDITCANQNPGTNPDFLRGPTGRNADLLASGRRKWSPWTPCNLKTSQKARFRNCKDRNPNSCEIERKPC